jgi:hypothetical protein
MRICAHILAAVALAVSIPAASAQTAYKFTTVNGPAPSAGGTQLAGINNAGKVAGITIDAAGNRQAFFGVPGGTLTALGLPYGAAWAKPFQAIVSSINDYDEVLAYVPRNTKTNFEGFMFEFYEGELLTFPVPWALDGAPARSMNDDDTIAGSFANGGKTSGYTLDVWNNLAAFDAAPGVTWTSASTINNLGVVVGNYLVPQAPRSVSAGFLRDSTGKITLLPTPIWIGSVAVGPGGITYNGINDHGVTVGSFLDAANHSHGFVRDASGHFTLVQHPSGLTTTGVVGINNGGTIAGNFIDAAGVEHGFIATL